MAMDKMVDKTKLSAAFKILQETKNNINFWHKDSNKSKEDAIMKNLRLQELYEMAIPVSKENIGKIKSRCQPAQFGKGLNKAFDSTMMQAWEIPASQINFSCELERLLAYVVAQKLLGCKTLKEEDVVLKLKKLVLYPQGGHFKSCYNPSSNKKELRTFAKVILTIPVEDGHKGGRLKIRANGMNNCCNQIDRKNSARLFSVTAIYSDCYFEMEPVTSGSILTLEFKLMSKHPFLSSRSSSIHYSTFFSALSEIRDSCEPLADWTVTLSVEKQLKSIIETSKGMASDAYPFAEVIKPESKVPMEILNRDMNENSTRHGHLELEEKMDHMWIFPLKHDYSSSVDFGTLSRLDLIYFDLLRSINFIDVHLAIVAQSVPGENSSDYSINCEDEDNDNLKDRSCYIDEWRYSSNSLPISGKFKLDFHTQLLGNIERFIKKTNIQDPITKEHYTVFYHAVFIIQPRQQSIYLGCYRNFDRVLDQMCFLAKSSSTDAPIRQYLITNLKHCLSFCKMEPDRVWNVDELCKNVSRAQRMMDMCINLNTKEEGLELLSILGMNLELLDPEISEIDPSANAEESQHFCEGIRDAGVAEAIANFQCRISSWQDCSELVLNLIQPSNLKQQLDNFTSLIRNFVDNGCFEGAMKTANRLWFVFGQLDWSNGFEGNEMGTYLEIVAQMEGNPKLADPKRISQFLSFFRSLRCYQQCDILLHCKIDEYFKSIPSCVQIHQEFFRILCDSELENSFRVSSRICRLILCFSFPEKGSLLIPLIDKILLGQISQVESETEDVPRNILLEEIIKSVKIWKEEPWIVNRLLDSPAVANVLPKLYDEVVRSFRNISRSEDALQDGKLTEDVQKMLSQCFLFVSCMEKYSQFTDPVRLAKFSYLVSQLSIAELAYLFINLDESDCHRFKDQVSNSSVLSSASVICKHALLRSAELINSQSYDNTKLFDKFVYLGKPSEVQSLIVSVCQTGEKIGWEKSGNEGFVEHALNILCSWKEVDSNLQTFPSKIVCDFVANLIKSWINEFSFWELSQFDIESLESITNIQAPKLARKMAVIFTFLIKAEINWPGQFAAKNAERFQRLLSKLPFKIFILLINYIYHCELEDGGALKETNLKVNCPSSCNLFRELCRQCLSHQHYSDSSSRQEILMKCFIWLDNDRDSLNFICNKISAIQIKRIVASKIFQELAFAASSHGKTAFCSLIDRCIQDLKASMYPDLTWSMPEAKYPEYPDIEAFLHSTMKELKYGNFASCRDANKFAELLRINPSLGLSANVDQKMPRLWQVDIVKIRQRHFALPTEEEAKKLELAKLTELRASLYPNVQNQKSEQRGEKRKTSD